MKVSQNQIDIHNKFCHEGRAPKAVYEWQGCPYPDPEIELFKCRLCDLQFILLNKKNKEGKFIFRSWDNYLEETIK